ncbi:hypothetical protein [Streptosporangium sp. NPDC002524]|uniref:hypothetical protein n=1 Tax=Streptosporangium sp. NPDC002524 TaxID=3154537 RepID=UPI00331CB52E
MTPGDFEHVDGLVIESEETFSISLVREKGTDRLFVEVLHGQLHGEKYMYAPLDVDITRVGSLDTLAEAMGTEEGR